MICEQARAFWVAAPGKGEIRDEPLRDPSTERERMAAPCQAGACPAPVKYGYASVGTVEHGPAALEGRQAFVLFPHQTCYVVPTAAVHPLPDGVPPARAVLAANLETAI